MTEGARASVVVAVPPARAFTLFTAGLGEWWPREYTWSQDVLEGIGIEPLAAGGLCVEHGPDGFTCHWGRVLAWEPPSRVVLAWQIAPSRAPEPNGEHASTVTVSFEAVDGGTRVVAMHAGFDRHGDGWEAYEAAMGAPQGWPYILERYRSMT